MTGTNQLHHQQMQTPSRKHQDYPRKHSLDLSKFRADGFAGMQEVLDSCARNISELQVLIDSLSYLVRTDLFTPSSIYDFQAMRLPEL